jgi:hypothetical protein
MPTNASFSHFGTRTLVAVSALAVIALAAFGARHYVQRGQAPASQGPSPEQSAPNAQVPAERAGDRLMFYLPKTWVERYWQGRAPAKAYIALLPPHPQDTEEEYAPCLPPARVVMGYVNADQEPHEAIVLCTNFCDPRPSGRRFQGLWGRLTRLEKVEVRVADDGTIDLALFFRKYAGSTDHSVYEGAPQVRHMRVKAPRAALPTGKAGSCLQRQDESDDTGSASRGLARGTSEAPLCQPRTMVMSTASPS